MTHRILPSTLTLLVLLMSSALLVLNSRMVAAAAGGASCAVDTDCHAPMIPGTNLNNGLCQYMSPSSGSRCVCYAGIGGASCGCRSSVTCSGTGACNDDGTCACHAWSENGTESGTYFGARCECKRNGDACHTSTGSPGVCVSPGGCQSTADKMVLQQVVPVSPSVLCDVVDSAPVHHVQPAADRTLVNTNFVFALDTCFTVNADGQSFTLRQDCLAKYSNYGIIAMFAYRITNSSTYTATRSLGAGADISLSYNTASGTVEGTLQWNLRGCVFGYYLCGCGQCSAPVPCTTRAGVLLYIYQYAN